MIITSNRMINALFNSIHTEPVVNVENVREAIPRLMSSPMVQAFAAEDLLHDIGCGVVSDPDFLKLVAIEKVTLFRKPKLDDELSVGIDHVEVASVVNAVIQLERMGMSVDPEPLVKALLPLIGRKDFITAAELNVFWFAKERHKLPALMVKVDEVVVIERREQWITSKGYGVDASICGNGVHSLYISPPEMPRRRKTPVR